MSFVVSGDAYQRFMGRYADALAVEFLASLSIRGGERALDVGAGTGALTERLANALGPGAVSAIEPSEPFAAALRERLPGVEVRQGVAEALPYADAAFDLTVAQLVVHFMTDPVAGLREMARVTAPGGRIGATTWDFGGGRAPLSLFWRAARDLDPSVEDESDEPGARAGHLLELFAAAGLTDARDGTLAVTRRYEDFEDWWQPYTLGVGPAGAHVAGLSAEHRDALRGRLRSLLPDGPIVVEAVAWSVVAVKPRER